MPPQQDADNSTRSRPRANTTTFTFPSWRRGRPEAAPPVPTILPAPSLSFEALIEALKPPAVPSLSHARSLANLLVTQTPLPRPTVLNPVLAALCGKDTPPALQVAGFDIMTAYWENSGAATNLGTADRLSYFSLFLGAYTAWSSDIWEARFRALRALTSSGAEAVGMESQVLDLLMSWIEGAFEGLLSYELVDPAERAERQRSIEALAASVISIAENVEIVARIPEEELAAVLQFYADLVERALDLPTNFTTQVALPSNPSTDTRGSPASTPSKATHRRHPSSLSIPAMNPPPAPPPLKHPADLMVTVYINHLNSQLKTSAPSHLTLILPLLFRALAFYASPLPRLSITSEAQTSPPLEKKLTDTITSLFGGPFAASCGIILKRHLFPQQNINENLKGSIQVSTGAHRSFRNFVRRRLHIRIARAFINRESSVNYGPSGAPGHIDMERDVMERAWPKDDVQGWDADRLGNTICRSVEAWANLANLDPIDNDELNVGREKILDEVAGTLKDVFQELDMRDDDTPMDDEAASAVGETLYRLATYVHVVKNPDGTPFLIPLSQPTSAPTPFLRTLASLLARDHSTYLNPLLSTTLLYVADHLTDADTAKLPTVMFEQHDLSPTSPEWLSNWENIMSTSDLLSQVRPLTRTAAMNALEAVYESVKDMPGYRMPLADLVFQFCRQQVAEEKEDSEGEVMWRILGEEVVLRSVDRQDTEQSGENSVVEEYMTLLTMVAAGTNEDDDDDDDTASVYTVETHSPSPLTSTGPSNSPTLSRMQSDYPNKDKDTNLPSVMSLLSSLTTGPSSRSQSQQPHEHEDQSLEVSNTPPTESTTLPRAVGAVIALIGIFSQLAFTPHALAKENLDLAVRIYNTFITLMVKGKSSRARLTILQFMMRTRADRDHRMYFVDAAYDPDGCFSALASLIDRAAGAKEGPREEPTGDPDFLRKARARFPQERDGRRVSRGRGTRVSHSESSRSRSRATRLPLRGMSAQAAKPRDPTWQVPESLPFVVFNADTPSEGLMSYDPVRGEHEHVLQLSDYLIALIKILDHEKNWEILSYVLCQLPVQLANKHLFCGPKCRELLAKLLTTLCTGLINGELASEVDRWPQGLKTRDAQGLAYHTVSVLISYRRCFDGRQQHILVEVLQAGLNGQPSAIKCCLHGLSLAAFELQSSMKKCLTRILEKLSQIMSNPEMAVHILSFLVLVGSLRELHYNFTEGDFKMVFGVALQYLQHYNRPGSSPTTSWALSQHLRLVSYYTIYSWFLAVKLPDRPQHIPYITRQLLLANEGKEEVDEPTEVCFDWLARYTYASADPRPANSLLSEIVMSPTTSAPPEVAVTEKTWIMGNAFITIRTLARLGWIEILSRRPSGYTKFLCRVENVPMVGTGDVDPDMMSIPASLIMERGPAEIEAPTTRDASDESVTQVTADEHLLEDKVRDIFKASEETENPPSKPNPFTGYVWSGSAPSQRRKHVALDPSFCALHLSPYPKAGLSPENHMIADPALLPALFRSLDRMPVIDTHKVGIMYVAPGQTDELQILRNMHGSPAYTRFLEGIGRLINLRGQVDVYAGGLDPDDDGEYAYAWWDDIGQTLFHTATMMPTMDGDPQCVNKKKHIGNDYVRIVWNDSGMPYTFDTLQTQFQFVNIVVEPHSLGAIAAFSNNIHENEYFKVTVQRAPGMIDFAPIGEFKLISAENLPPFVRQLSLLADWFASIFRHTEHDTVREEVITNWRSRLQAIQRFREKMPKPDVPEPAEGIFAQEAHRDFTISF